MRINLEEISSRIKQEIRSYSKDLAVDDVADDHNREQHGHGEPHRGRPDVR